MLGYTSWHQLFVYSCNSCLLSSYMLFSYPSVQLFIMLFSYLMFAVYLVIILCTFFICTSSPLYTHTYQVAFDDPGFARPDIGRFVSIVRCWMRPYILLGAWVSLFLINGIPALLFIYRILLHFLFLFICYRCVRLYMYYCSDYDLA